MINFEEPSYMIVRSFAHADVDRPTLLVAWMGDIDHANLMSESGLKSKLTFEEEECTVAIIERAIQALKKAEEKIEKNGEYNVQEYPLFSEVLNYSSEGRVVRIEHEERSCLSYQFCGPFGTEVLGPNSLQIAREFNFDGITEALESLTELQDKIERNEIHPGAVGVTSLFTEGFKKPFPGTVLKPVGV